MFSVGTELMTECWEEFLPLAERHWEEVGHDGWKCNPSKQFYFGLEEAGDLVMVTARDEGVLVGYVIVLVTTHPHSGEILASVDGIYVMPSHRGGGLSAPLLECVEDVGSFIGATLLTINSTMKMPLGKLFKGLGFKEEEVVYSKVLGTS